MGVFLFLCQTETTINLNHLGEHWNTKVCSIVNSAIGGYVFGRVGLFVRLTVSTITHKVMNGFFHETFTRGVFQANKQSITFWG